MTFRHSVTEGKVVPLNEKKELLFEVDTKQYTEAVRWTKMVEAVEGLKKDFVSKLAKHNLTDEQLILLIFHECVDARLGK